MTVYHKYCAACESKELIKALDLGTMPNANEFVYKKDLEKVKKYHLVYYWCKNCGLFQQIELIDNKTLFQHNYTYKTGVNVPAIEHFKKISRYLVKHINANEFAIVIGSNDGTEIKLLKDVGFKKVIGVEPATNMAMIANKAGLQTVNSFFTNKLSKSLVNKYGKADLIVANNVFAHITNPYDVLLGMKNLIKNDGKIVIEVQWFRDVLRKLSIDTLYSEHYYEWTTRAMIKLSDRVGLKLVKAIHLPNQQGGSIRFILQFDGITDRKLENIEQIDGVYNLDKILDMQNLVEKRRKKLVKLLTNLKSRRKKIVIWAVPAKVSTILNLFNIDSSLIDCAYDATPTKIGRYIPGVGIEIKDEDLLNPEMADRPDYIIIGAWNYLNYAMRKLKWFTDDGGKLINLLNAKIISRSDKT
ncbi:MAG: methyltransferase domain-containing protein [Nitrososphaerota archaeon]|jgi:methylation protein EvaC|nr:methyltransferase domain-containing protein [Nitrososphaerota archaeon]MDG6935876.1 methyltransferase domain-containing protein [Nitrososphaerota archaeon]MDG6943486.1 methyltransferase domain-containing protein [Nitrososphaerota archaeon]